MRVAFFYPNSCVSRVIDVNNIWTSSRGLTGSELSCFMYAIELSKLGHDVTIFTKINKPGNIGKTTVCSYDDWSNVYHSQHWDALCSWMNPEPLKIANSSQFRFFNQQVSDFYMCESGWESYVDIMAPLSNSHARYMKSFTKYDKSKWRILHNGVDTQKFKPNKKSLGKIIWASSHDRGLHWLLEAFPKVLNEYPWANLHIFYNFDGLRSFAEDERNHPVGSISLELSNRSKYTREALRRLEGKNVFVYESVSRERIVEEMNTSEILAYPCDPVRFTETFGVTVLEACAAGTVPVITDADAFGELWGSASKTSPAPYIDHKEEYINNLINTLKNSDELCAMSTKCTEYAKNFQWSILARKLETCLKTRGELGLPNVDWD